MKLDRSAVDYTPGNVGAIAKRAEASGYDGFWLAETKHDPFLALAGAAAATERIGLFMTVHVPLVHPLYAAKSLATVDHISQGRAGLNIVCGWNPKEFGMFGTPLVEKGYVQATEWLDILERLYASDEPIDHEGAYYHLKQAVSRPASVQTPRPVTMPISDSPASSASSTPYWISGLLTIGSISLGMALVAGRKRVP